MDLNRPSTSSNHARIGDGGTPEKKKRDELNNSTRIVDKVDEKNNEGQAELDQFFTSQNNATLNAGILQRFPISDHESLYRRIGTQSRSLTVSDINPEQAKEMFPYFTNLDALIVDWVELNEEICRSFPSVRSLKLSQCWSTYCIVQHWFAHMNDKLECIHFDRVSSYVGDSFEESGYYDRNYSFVLENLHHLILENSERELSNYYMNISTFFLDSLTILGNCDMEFCDMSKLRKLTIDCNSFSLSYPLPIRLPSLEFLSIRLGNVDEFLTNLRFILSLKTFECHSAPRCIEEILKWKKLEHVKIHCNWYHAEELQRHFASLPGIKCFEVTCCAGTKGYHILNSLNKDCLRLIPKYLTEKDLVSLTRAYPQFISYVPCLKINSKFLETYPAQNSDFYEDIGKRVGNLKIKRLSVSDCNLILAHFQDLRTLYLENITVLNHFDFDLIPSVEELSLHIYQPSSDVAWKDFFRRIGPNLRSFEFVYDSDFIENFVDGLNELENLERIVVCGYDENIEGIYYKFLQNNKNLYHIQINMTDISVLDYVNAENIRVLIFECDMEIEKALVINRFPKLVKLSLVFPDPKNCYIYQLKLDYLKSLIITEIESPDPSFVLKCFDHFPSLRKVRVKIVEKYFIRFSGIVFKKAKEGMNYLVHQCHDCSLLLTRLD